MDLLNKVKAIVDKNAPLYSNLSNVSAVLNELGDLNWCGFYIAQGDTLFVGPFQGDVACVRIPFGKGVCGTSALKQETIIVPNVNEFPGHIACSSLSKSEIVTPIIKNGTTVGVIDIDSPVYSRFTDKDKEFLELVADSLKELF
ncbi:MAG: GAF domain-containing protein [Bacilli bacterium]|nr:GAF domain-containing protein [Bacilli bacterium]